MLLQQQRGWLAIVLTAIATVTVAALLSAQFGDGWIWAASGIVLVFSWFAGHRDRFSAYRISERLEQAAQVAAAMIGRLVEVRPDAHTPMASLQLTLHSIPAPLPPPLPSAGITLTPRLSARPRHPGA